MAIYNMEKEHWMAKLKLKIPDASDSYLIWPNIMCESYGSLNLVCKFYVGLNIVTEFQHKSHGIPMSEDDRNVETEGQKQPSNQHHQNQGGRKSNSTRKRWTQQDVKRLHHSRQMRFRHWDCHRCSWEGHENMGYPRQEISLPSMPLWCRY